MVRRIPKKTCPNQVKEKVSKPPPISWATPTSSAEGIYVRIQAPTLFVWFKYTVYFASTNRNLDTRNGVFVTYFV